VARLNIIWGTTNIIISNEAVNMIKVVVSLTSHFFPYSTGLQDSLVRYTEHALDWAGLSAISLLFFSNHDIPAYRVGKINGHIVNRRVVGSFYIN
jgi:hypothetical protein